MIIDSIEYHPIGSGNYFFGNSRYVYCIFFTNLRSKRPPYTKESISFSGSGGLLSYLTSKPNDYEYNRYRDLYEDLVQKEIERKDARILELNKMIEENKKRVEATQSIIDPTKFDRSLVPDKKTFFNIFRWPNN